MNLFDSERKKITISYLRGLKTPSSAPRRRHRAGFKPVVVVCNKTAMMTGPRGGRVEVVVWNNLIESEDNLFESEAKKMAQKSMTYKNKKHRRAHCC